MATIELQDELFQKLQSAAQARGLPVEEFVHDWLVALADASEQAGKPEGSPLSASCRQAFEVLEAFDRRA